MIIVGIRCRLTKDGAKDIELLVFSAHMDGNPPCVAIRDWNWKMPQLFVGNYDSLDEVFDDEVKKHPGYTVKDRGHLEIPDP